MADAKRCDRCGKYYSLTKGRKISGISTILEKSGYINDYFDLCDDCMDEFDIWIQKFQPGDSQ